MKSYVGIVAPLSDLLRKDAFLWIEEETSNFVALKAAMTHAPMLAFPDFD